MQRFPNLNNYIGDLLFALLKPSADTTHNFTPIEKIPAFHIVKPFLIRRNYDFESVYYPSARCNLENGLGCAYKHPHAHSSVLEIVYAPDGAVLIPDTVLARLENEAQCAALLSYSLAATDQNVIEGLFRVQRFKGNFWTLSY